MVHGEKNSSNNVFCLKFVVLNSKTRQCETVQIILFSKFNMN